MSIVHYVVDQKSDDCISSNMILPHFFCTKSRIKRTARSCSIFPAHQHIDMVAKLHIEVALDMQHTRVASAPIYITQRKRAKVSPPPKESKLELTPLHFCRGLFRNFLSFFYYSFLVLFAQRGLNASW